jgi:hypothetical protein
VYALRILNDMGLIRIAAELGLIPMLNKRMDSMPEEIRAVDKYMIYKNMLNDMVIREGDGLKDTAKKIDGKLDFGDMPLIVFAVEKSLEEFSGWEASQDSLLEMSNDSKMIILRNSSHISVLQDNAEEISKAIKELVNKVHGLERG